MQYNFFKKLKNKNFPFNKPLSFAFVIFLSVMLTLGLSISLQNLRAVWQEPVSAPPANNVLGPLNVGPDAQTKSGDLRLDSKLTLNNGFTLFEDDNSILNFNQVSSNYYYINSNKGIQFRLDSDNNDANAGFQINDGNNNTLLKIGEDGKMGIGNTNPSEALDVSGNIKANSFIGSGSGLTGITGASILDGTLTHNDININSIQRRVTGTCDDGQSIRAISNTGTVDCEPDDVGDPRIGTLTNGKWCTSNGTAVNCTSDAPTVEGGAFGGLYGRSANDGSCVYVNPYTGACSCPATFNNTIILSAAQFAAPASILHMCWK